MDHEPFFFRHEGYLVSVRAAPESHADEDTLQAVNRFALRPLTRDEFVVFTLDLCNNQVDKHHSRFPEDELAKVSELVPGRPLMERHDLRGSLPRGTFFRSRLHEEEGVVSVRCEVYVLRTAENEGFIRNIEGGVYRETSIGFSFQTPECSLCGNDIRACGHVPGRVYEERACHFIMRNVVEVIEGSVVASGSQGTRFVVSDNARELPLLAMLEEREAPEDEPALPASAESAAAVRAIEAAVAECHADMAQAAALVRDGVSARQRATARLIGLGRELDGDAFDETAWRETVAGLNLDAIHAHLRAYEARFDAKYPPQPVSQPEPLEPEPEDRSGVAAEILRG